FARDRLYYTLGMCVDGSATIATLLCLPSHRSPRATEDGGGIANPGCHGYIQHGSEPPRSQLGQTWFIHHEAHLLQSRLIVNSNSPQNRYSETIPEYWDRLRSSACLGDVCPPAPLRACTSMHPIPVPWCDSPCHTVRSEHTCLTTVQR